MDHLSWRHPLSTDAREVLARLDHALRRTASTGMYAFLLEESIMIENRVKQMQSLRARNTGAGEVSIVALQALQPALERLLLGRAEAQRQPTLRLQVMQHAFQEARASLCASFIQENNGSELKGKNSLDNHQVSRQSYGRQSNVSAIAAENVRAESPRFREADAAGEVDRANQATQSESNSPSLQFTSAVGAAEMETNSSPQKPAQGRQSGRHSADYFYLREHNPWFRSAIINAMNQSSSHLAGYTEHQLLALAGLLSVSNLSQRQSILMLEMRRAAPLLCCAIQVGGTGLVHGMNKDRTLAANIRNEIGAASGAFHGKICEVLLLNQNAFEIANDPEHGKDWCHYDRVICCWKPTKEQLHSLTKFLHPHGLLTYMSSPLTIGRMTRLSHKGFKMEYVQVQSENSFTDSTDMKLRPNKPDTPDQVNAEVHSIDDGKTPISVLRRAIPATSSTTVEHLKGTSDSHLLAKTPKRQAGAVKEQQHRHSFSSQSSASQSSFNVSQQRSKAFGSDQAKVAQNSVTAAQGSHAVRPGALHSISQRLIEASDASSPAKLADCMDDNWNVIMKDLQSYIRPVSSVASIKSIGEGVFATVQSAVFEGQSVAYKILKTPSKSSSTQAAINEVKQDFCREAALNAGLDCPCVVHMLAIIPSSFGIVFEMVDGSSLFHILQTHREKKSFMHWRMAKNVCLDIATGMSYLHARVPAIIHRDLKSQNVLVRRSDFKAKVCDLGLSKLKHKKRVHSRRAAGSPGWMAPEILRGDYFDERADVFAFAIIVWELVTLDVPWKGFGSVDILHHVGHKGRRPELPKVFPTGYPVLPLTGLIERCWHQDPEARPSFDEIADLLEEM